MAYHSEAAKVRDMSNVMKYITGNIIDLGCGPDKITPDAFGVDGRHLPGVNYVTDEPTQLYLDLSDGSCQDYPFDTVFSSHFLEHLPNQYEAVCDWRGLLKVGGHLVLYLPDGKFYDNKENLEHTININFDDFMFWFRRCFCGEGKDFRGNHLKKLFELVDSGMDIGPDRYSFFVIGRKV
jgi:SAM-dependent methyltransferase